MIYINAIIRKSISLIKLCLLKLKYVSKLKFNLNESISLSTRIIIRKNSKIVFGNKISTRNNVEFNANCGGRIEIGDNTFFNNNCIIAAHEKIEIGKNCIFGPNVVMYDHDHDFRRCTDLDWEKYKSSPIKIGKNVWIGANAIILRGVTIGDNAVIAAGTIVKEDIKENMIYHSKIINEQKAYNKE